MAGSGVDAGTAYTECRVIFPKKYKYEPIPSLLTQHP